MRPCFGGIHTIWSNNQANFPKFEGKVALISKLEALYMFPSTLRISRCPESWPKKKKLHNNNKKTSEGQLVSKIDSFFPPKYDFFLYVTFSEGTYSSTNVLPTWCIKRNMGSCYPGVIDIIQHGMFSLTYIISH